jgi:hypothetical protein
MPKTWNRGDERRFVREIKLNKPYFIVYEIARNLAPWEDAKLYSEVVFTSRLPLTATPCTEGGYSAATLLRLYGPVYDTPPARMRNIADIAPSVGAPLGNNYEGILDEAELRGLRKQLTQASDPASRRSIGRWRV